MIATDLPRLKSAGIPLEMEPDKFGSLRSSASIAEDRQRLRERMAEDGYLFLPGYLDRDEALASRQVIAERLAERGYLDPAYAVDEAIQRPELNATFLPELAHNNAPLSKLLYTGAMMELFERFFGEEVLHYDFTWLRAQSFGKSAPPHCDIVYMGRGTFDVLTAWTPLGHIPLDHGVLMILEGSHRKRRELEEYLKRDVDTYCSNGPNATKIESGEMGWEWDGALSYDATELRRSLGGRWLTAEFTPGDLLLFTMATVHCSADNQTNRIRLSTDSRYQRASEPADERWIGANPIAHGRAGKRGRIC